MININQLADSMFTNTCKAGLCLTVFLENAGRADNPVFASFGVFKVNERMKTQRMVRVHQNQ